MRELKRSGVRLLFSHTKHDNNAIADFLVNIALEKQGYATWEELGLLLALGDAPPWDPRQGGAPSRQMASMEAGVKRPRGEPGAEDDKID